MKNKLSWAILLLLCTTCVANSATLQGLGFLPDTPNYHQDSVAWDISADGSTVVGDSFFAETAFRWTEADGMVALAYPGGDMSSFSRAEGVSADGSVVVGDMGQTYPSSEAFRWTEETGMVGLGHLDESNNTYARDVSADGSVVVGESSSGIGFRWTQETGMVALDSSGEWLSSNAKGISSDGSVIVGSGLQDEEDTSRAFRWTRETGMIDLGNLESEHVYSQAFAVSSDGSTVAGEWQSNEALEAFVWTQDEGMVGLGTLGETFESPLGTWEPTSRAFDVSADGSVIVGANLSGAYYFTQEAFIWDRENGMRNLQEVLETEYGLDTSSWDLSWATGISDDGSTIVGIGSSIDGSSPEAWMVVIPEPTTMILLSFGVMFIRKRN